MQGYALLSPGDHLGVMFRAPGTQYPISGPHIGSGHPILGPFGPYSGPYIGGLGLLYPGAGLSISSVVFPYPLFPSITGYAASRLWALDAGLRIAITWGPFGGHV